MAVTTFDALDLILNNTISIKNTQLIKIENSSFRISSKTITATYPLPRFNNSAMDGYAIKFDDANAQVKVIDKVFAGDSKDLVLTSGNAIKIMTGGKIPEGTTAIVPQEDIEVLENNYIKLPNNIKENQHIRFLGEDVEVGDLIIKENEEINYATVSLLASQGISEVEVYARPKIAVFGSGEELRPHFEKIEPHQIYNSNTPTLVSRCQELGCETTFIGSAKDNLEDIKSHIQKSLDYDLVITTGGVSVGEADFTKEAFESFGMNFFCNGITIKPGKPTIFGKINNTLVLNLPGNPLSAQLIFELFGKIILQKLRGSSDIYHNIIKAKIGENLQNRKGRPTIIVGNFDGEYFIPSKKRSPGMVSVLNNCNSMIVLNENIEQLNINQEVKVLPLDWKFFSKEKKDFLTYVQ